MATKPVGVFDERRWREKKTRPERLRIEGQQAMAKALAEVGRQGSLAAVLFAMETARMDRAVVEFLEPPKKMKPRRKRRKPKMTEEELKESARVRARRYAAQKRKERKAAELIAEQERREIEGPKPRKVRKPSKPRRKAPKGKKVLTPWRRRRPHSAAPVASSNPPVAQLILRAMEPGRVYSIVEIAALLPDGFTGATEEKPFDGRGKKGARVFWRVYGLREAGLLERYQIWKHEPTTNFFWLSKEGIRWHEVARHWWNWRFNSCSVIVRQVHANGPDGAFAHFLATARRMDKYELRCLWAQMPGRELVEDPPNWRGFE